MRDYWRLRPPLPNRTQKPQEEPARGKPVVLVVGAYLVHRPTNVEHVSAELGSGVGYDVRQSWASVGGAGNTRVPTILTFDDLVPKYVAINALLDQSDLRAAEYLVVCDDDIGLPPSFLDRFLAVQSALGFVLAQPARSGATRCDHDIVRQEVGTLARQTLFVETGPCFSAHRSIFNLILPFDLESPMGWGYEYVWAYRLAASRLPMGIVDATPVEHTLRATAAHYDWWHAYEAQRKFLAAHAHLAEEACHRVLKTFPIPGREGSPYDTGRDIRRQPLPPR